MEHDLRALVMYSVIAAMRQACAVGCERLAAWAAKPHVRLDCRVGSRWGGFAIGGQMRYN